MSSCFSSSGAERLLCLLNPHAAAGRTARLRAPMADWLQARGLGQTLQVPGSAAEARERIAAMPAGSRILVVGGDGTVQQLLRPIVEGGHELALIPAGTGNDLARALGLQRLASPQALAHALEAPGVGMDVGELLRMPPAASSYFLSSLTVGFDAAVGARAQASPPWLRGLLRYLWATLAEVRHLRNYPVRIALDGVDLPVPRVLLASCLNTASYASGMPVAPGARIDDGQLNLVLAHAMGRARVLGLMPVMLAGQHGRLGSVHLQPFRQMDLHGDRPLPLALDGEPVPACGQFQVRVQPQGLRVVAGAGFSPSQG